MCISFLMIIFAKTFVKIITPSINSLYLYNKLTSLKQNHDTILLINKCSEQMFSFCLLLTFFLVTRMTFLNLKG